MQTQTTQHTSNTAAALKAAYPDHLVSEGLHLAMVALADSLVSELEGD